MDDLTLAQAKWRSSGLTDEQAQTCGMEGLDGSLTAALAPNFHATESLFLPYFGLDGERTSFFRVRYLGKLGGFAGLVDRPQRYAQPAGTLNEVYLPPLVQWRGVADDPERPLLITEGELKAAAATARGFPTVGLGGVDVWRAQKRGIGLLPALEAIKWTGRTVAVVFDSDASSNPNVTRAQRQLAEVLTERGAKVSIVALPPAEGGGKQGLDDYLLTHSDEELRALLNGALPWDEGNKLWGLNEEIVYVRDPGMIVHRATGEKFSCDAFTAHRYANRHYLREKSTANGIVLVKEPLAPRWMEWEARAEVARMTYRPGQPCIVDGEWNTWRGWGATPVPGDITPWNELLDYVFKGHLGERHWFEQWAACPFQHPGVKQYTAALIWGSAQGTGKTLIGYTLMGLYGDNAASVCDADLKSAFNEWAIDKQFIVGDEVTGSDKRRDADRFKSLITQSTLRINKKYVPSYAVPDCISYYFTSNHPDAFFVEDPERRYFIHELVGGPLSDEFYARYDKWYKSQEGKNALMAHLLSLDLTGYNPRARAPHTAALEDMVVHTRSDVAGWVADMLEDPVPHLRPLGDAAKHCAAFTPGQLLGCYQQNDPGRRYVTANGLGRELRRRGVPQRIVRTKHGVTRLYLIRDAERWAEASPKDLVDHFEQYFPEVSEKF